MICHDNPLLLLHKYKKSKEITNTLVQKHGKLWKQWPRDVLEFQEVSGRACPEEANTADGLTELGVLVLMRDTETRQRHSGSA